MLDKIKDMVSDLGLVTGVSSIKNKLRVRTMYVHEDGENIDIYIENRDSRIILSDMAQTLQWVYNSGNELDEQVMSDLIEEYNLHKNKGMIELYLDSIDSIPYGLLSFSLACSNIAKGCVEMSKIAV